MIQKLQKFFHTDKWWGKTIFIVLTYILYWCIFYGSWFLMPDEWFLEHNHRTHQFFIFLFIFFLFVLLPILSFFIPSFIKKTFKINKIFLYILHVFLIIISIALFLIFTIFSAFSNMQIG